ncbi:MAG: hypothetical protein ACK56F_32080, partial [bacterium]
AVAVRLHSRSLAPRDEYPFARWVTPKWDQALADQTRRHLSNTPTNLEVYHQGVGVLNPRASAEPVGTGCVG